MVAVWTNLQPVPLPVVIVLNVLLFVGIFSRIIPSQALMSAIPEITKRGAFNAIGSSLQQFSGGIASVIAGLIIVQGSDGHLQHYNWLGYIVMVTSLLALTLMYFIHKTVAEKLAR
jgi:MFS family permease